MIRMTIALVASITAVMMIFGQPVDRPEGSDQVAIESIEPVQANPAVGSQIEVVGLDDEVGAVRLALAASSAPAAAPAAATPALVVRPVFLGGVSVQKASLEKAPATGAPDFLVVTGSRVNLREGPSTAFDVVGQVIKGDRAEMIENPGNGWVRIRQPNGAVAWISSRFVQPSS